MVRLLIREPPHACKIVVLGPVKPIETVHGHECAIASLPLIMRNWLRFGLTG